MSEPQLVYHLALRELHAAAGATFVAHAGWSLPAHYGDLAAEYAALRGAAAVFDRSYRSRFMVTGTDAGELLAKVFAGHAEELEEGRAMRTVALDAEGTIADVVLIARTGGIAYLVTGEPGRRSDTFARLRANAGEDWDVGIEDRTETTCLVALAGPGAADAATEHLSEALQSRLPSLHAVTFEFHGFRALAIRTSDAGEDGFEFVLAPAVAQHIIETLRAGGVPLVGLNAQENARIETCIPAFDPDLEPGLSPAEADLDVLLGIPGGREARILAAVLLEGSSIPAKGTAVAIGGAPAGEVRSATWSPALQSVVALALLDARQALPGTNVDAAGIPGTIVAKPLYRRRA
ncbi:MAG: hypothetical protein IT303_07650 [Dehalococcoidia bacterium]|nr:hypothetical protein [Dehalococcoidia bacterium]